MSPTEKLIKIHQLTAHAIKNPTPYHTIAQIVTVVAEPEAQNLQVETPVLRHLPSLAPGVAHEAAFCHPVFPVAVALELAHEMRLHYDY